MSNPTDPEASHRKRERQQERTHCQKPAVEPDEDMSRNSKDPTAQSCAPGQSPSADLLSLPQALRRRFFYDILDDDEIPVVSLPKEFRRLVRVCQGFRDDAQWVFLRWRRRERELAAGGRLKSSTARAGGQSGSKTTGLLALPRELRQNILYNILSDDEISTTPPNEEATHLSAVCTIFRNDAEWVLPQWQKRKEELAAQRGLERGAFDSYIADLLAPIKAASKSVHEQNYFRYEDGKRRKVQAQNVARRLSKKGGFQGRR